MSTTSQLTFDLEVGSSNNYSEHDFVVLDEHKDSYDVLDKFFAQGDYADSNFPHLILQGDEFSGKTHLLNVFSQKYGFKIYSCKQIKDEDTPSLFLGNKFLVIDDADDLSDDNLLFHIYNLSLESGVFLLLSLKDIDVFKLKDLVSRLRNIVRTKIKEPDIDLIKILLSKGFSKRQLKIDRKIIDFLALNISRKYRDIEDIILKIEQFCFENKKTITLGDVKGVI